MAPTRTQCNVGHSLGHSVGVLSQRRDCIAEAGSTYKGEEEKEEARKGVGGCAGCDRS